MPERRRRLPPAIEKLLEEDEVTNLFPDDEFGNLPEDLRPQAVYDRWAQEDPYGLYLLQLRDYLIKARTGGEGGLAPGGIPKMTRQQSDDIQQQVEELIRYEYPVESMPFYKQVSRTRGPVWERAYFTYLDQEFELDRQEEAKMKQRQSLYGNYQDPKGQATRNAIASGAITEEEAQDLITQGQWQDRQNAALRRPQDMSNEELIRAVREGNVTNQEAFGSLEQTVDEYGNPMTYRQPGLGKWEGQQRESARLANEQVQRGGRGNEDLIRTIRDAKAAGIDTSVYEQAATAGSLPANTQGLYINALAQQLGQLRKQKAEDYTQYMTKAYPDQFQEYMKIGGGVQPGGFLGWFSQKPDYEQVTAQRESKLWDEYGDVMPAYLKELSTKGYGQVEPIEKWLETDPFGQIYNQKYKERKAARIESSRRRYAPLVRSF